MKTLMLIAAVCMSGCVYEPNNPPKTPDKVVDKGPTYFEQGETTVVLGSRYVYDEVAKTYRYLTSEEMQTRYRENLDKVVKVIKKSEKKIEEKYQDAVK